MVFGQIVVGSPGAGKTTYCNGMQHFLQLAGRKVAVINLDPANDWLPYDCSVNIEELIRLEDVMNQYNLGPNGGLVYCMDYLEKNLDWLENKLKPLSRDHYFIFDFPGQIELFTVHSNVQNIVRKMTNKWKYRLVAVQLVDSHLCSDAHKYVGASLVSLASMLHLELPQINVLSKIDLIHSFGKLPFNLEFYTESQDLGYLQECLNNHPRAAKFKKLNARLCEVIEDFSLVSFETLDIQDKDSVSRLVLAVDKANGYSFASLEAASQEFSQIIGSDPHRGD